MEKKNIYQKIIKVYNEVESVQKNAEVSVTQNSSYMAVTHDAVTKALHKPLAKAGIVIRPTQKSCVISTHEKQDKYKPELKNIIYRADVVASIDFINAENPTEILTSEATAYALDSGDKAVSKAYSMAIKMILLKTFMLESMDEEEARPTEPDSSYKEKPISQKAALNGMKTEFKKDPFYFESGTHKGQKFSEVVPEDFDSYFNKLDSLVEKNKSVLDLISRMKEFKQQTKGQ